MLDDLKENVGDAVIMNGDFVGHGRAAKPSDKDSKVEKKWANNLKIMTDMFDVVRSALPNKILLPTIGNNDVMVHNSVPCTSDR